MHHPSTPVIGTVPSNSPILAIKTAVDSHFDPGHAIIAILLLVGSVFAYTKLLSNGRK